MSTSGEENWQDRDDYALRSMAQTRATSKALRQPLGFVITLAGFDPTPAEEMPHDAQPSTSPFKPPRRHVKRRHRLPHRSKRKKLYALRPS